MQSADGACHSVAERTVVGPSARRSLGSTISRSQLNALASVLRTAPESDALVVLGRLLDSLPIGFHVSDCGGGLFHILYANRVWEHWLDPEKLPVAGKTLGELFPSAEEAGVLTLMRDVCATSQPKHLKGYEFRELGERGKRSETSRWDWEIYPLSGPAGVTHLLNVIMEVSAPRPRRNARSKEDRQAANLRREEASGVLRIFGLAPEVRDPRIQELLSGREREVGDLLAMGFTNRVIARQLGVSPATVSSHVSHILSKLGFRSRAQVAAWVVGRRLAAKIPAKII
jgi:DNA-binding CsgD family transcriptional regulator